MVNFFGTSGSYFPFLVPTRYFQVRKSFSKDPRTLPFVLCYASFSYLCILFRFILFSSSYCLCQISKKLVSPNDSSNGLISGCLFLLILFLNRESFRLLVSCQVNRGGPICQQQVIISYWKSNKYNLACLCGMLSTYWTADNPRGL